MRDSGPRSTPVAPSQMDSLSREDAERVAAGVLRDIAKESFRRHRSVVTSTREASQLVHLAVRLEGFANGESRPYRGGTMSDQGTTECIAALDRAQTLRMLRWRGVPDDVADLLFDLNRGLHQARSLFDALIAAPVVSRYLARKGYLDDIEIFMEDDGNQAEAEWLWEAVDG